jgi:hypothetical protein
MAEGATAERLVKDIPRKTRPRFSAEEKNRNPLPPRLDAIPATGRFASSSRLHPHPAADTPPTAPATVSGSGTGRMARETVS